MDFLRSSFLLPSIEIVEQPKKKALRFRYITESRKAGNIYGEHHTDASPRYPTIRIYNVSSPVTVRAFCVTPEGELHPFKLVGDSCTEEGLYECTTSPLAPHGSEISFTNVGIQCCKKDDVSQFLEQKKRLVPECNVPRNLSSINMTTVCLMFQVICSNTFRLLASAISHQITDKKHCTDATIVRVSLTTCEAVGGEELFILCNKVKKDDIEVVFSHGAWEGCGSFASTDVFKECAIVCRVPPFHDRNIRHNVEVKLFLREKSSKEISKPILFTYTPVQTDRYGIGNKRRAISSRNQICNSNSSSQYNSNNNLFIKTEFVPSTLTVNNTLPQPVYADAGDPRKLPIFCLEGDSVALKQEDKDKELAQLAETINSFVNELTQNEQKQTFAPVLSEEISNLDFLYVAPQLTSQHIPQLSLQQLTQLQPTKQLKDQQLALQKTPQQLTPSQLTNQQLKLSQVTTKFFPPQITQQLSNPQQSNLQQTVAPPQIQIALQQQLPNKYQLQNQQQLLNQQQLQNQQQLHLTTKQQNSTNNPITQLPVVSNDYSISIEEILNYIEPTKQYLPNSINQPPKMLQSQTVSQQHSIQDSQNVFNQQLPLQFQQTNPLQANNPQQQTVSLQQQNNSSSQPTCFSQLKTPLKQPKNPVQQQQPQPKTQLEQLTNPMQPKNLPQHLVPQNAIENHSQFLISNNDPLISDHIPSFQQWDLDFTGDLVDSELMMENLSKLFEDDNIPF